jgi:glyoxylase-like metal-dependent hydrolase (beta-lactamase superfamily II)
LIKSKIMTISLTGCQRERKRKMARKPDYPPKPGIAVQLEEGLRLVLAPNPSPMTLHGTNTYIIGTDQVAVIDPGPEDATHMNAILDALAIGETISHIFVTHAHLDHSPLARGLSAATGAPVLAYGKASAGMSALMSSLADGDPASGGEGTDHGFAPDICLADGQSVSADTWHLKAIHTPGHFSNHLSFCWGDVVFSGDHVMGWSSSLVSPPDGDMGAYMRSLDRLASHKPTRLYPGHGAPVDAPQERIAFLAAHRREREAAIINALSVSMTDARSLTRRIYTDTPEILLAAAARNVFAHLVDLSERNVTKPVGPLHFNSDFRLL